MFLLNLLINENNRHPQHQAEPVPPLEKNERCEQGMSPPEKLALY